MNLLLDTHALIWWDEGARLSRDARSAIRDADQVFVSAVSAWEVAIKTALGKIRPSRTVAEAVEESGFEELPVSFTHAALLATLPGHHRDPFDRMLVVQAQCEGLVLVTRDPVFQLYDLPVLKA